MLNERNIRQAGKTYLSVWIIQVIVVSIIGYFMISAFNSKPRATDFISQEIQTTYNN